MKKFISLILSIILISSSFFVVSAKTVDAMNIYGIYLTNQGDCSLIKSGNKWLLIDTGHKKSADELLKKLDYYNVKELSVLLSHLHTDHIGGMEKLSKSDIKITKLYMANPEITADSHEVAPNYEKMKTLVRNNNSKAQFVSLNVGSEFEIGSVSAKVIGPVNTLSVADFPYDGPTQTEYDHYENNKSLVVKFTCGNTTFLSAGDIEKQEESALIKAYKGTDVLKADIFKINHHALSTSNTEDFLKAVKPRFSYALNSNKNILSGSNYERYYKACKNAAKYGVVYLVGSEKKDYCAMVLNDRIKIYKGEEQLLGIVSLTGGDGTVVKNNLYYVGTDIKKSTVFTIDQKKYYIFAGGHIKKPYYSFTYNKYICDLETSNGDIRYFELDGAMYLGFRQVDGFYRYFDTDTGVMLIGTINSDPVKISSKKYAIDDKGIVFNYNATTGTFKEYYDNGTLKHRFFKADGTMKTGWHTLENGKKCYLSKTTGYRVIGTGLKTISGKKYYLKKTDGISCRVQSEWVKFGKKKRYFNKYGVMLTGKKKIGGKYYKFDKNGYLIK